MSHKETFPHREVACDNLKRGYSPSLAGIFILAWDGWGA